MRLSRVWGGIELRQEDLLLASLWCVDAALLQRAGEYSPLGIWLLVASAVFGCLAVRARVGSPGRMAWAIAVGASALTIQFYAPLHLESRYNWVAFFATTTVFAAVLARRRVARLALLTVAAGAVAVGASFLWAWGKDEIDVWTGVQVASSAVLHAHNPYGPTFPALYPHGLSFVTRQIHFDYGPAIPVLAAPFRLFGDIRVASVVLFIGLFAAVRSLARRRPDAAVAAPRLLALCIAFPLTMTMIGSAWVDIYAVAGLAGWIALRERHPRWAVLCLALGIASKPIFLPAMLPLLFWSRTARREAVQATLAALVFIAPFAIATGPAAFYHDVVGYLADFPFRPDSLSLNTMLFWNGRGTLPGWLGVTVVAVLCLGTVLHRPRSYGDVLAAGATISTVSFLLARQAFFNYYFLSAAVLLLALAGREVAFDAAEDVRLPWAIDRRFLAWVRGHGMRRALAPATAEAPAALSVGVPD